MPIIYLTAKEHLGESLNRNPNVPSTEACADTVSTILSMAGYPIPYEGIPTVLGLRQWMDNNGFTKVSAPQIGAIISSRTVDGSTGHIGICMKQGIASNNSFGGVRGRFTLNYSYNSWDSYFVSVHGCDLEYHIPPVEN